jgi:predicted ATPase
MGIHTGAADTHDGEYRGYLTLSLSQRLMSAGHGGQILISGAAEPLLRGQYAKDVSLRDLGKQTFRDVPEALRVFQVTAPTLQAEFPPLRSVPSHPNNLPTQLTSFIGREKELADIQKLLSDTHILTLIGPGGTGKTRLSIQVASALLDRFPDGLWLVELAPILDPLLIPRFTALTMGLRDEPQRPVVDMLCDYLRGKKMLIILDNCEHLVDACARMADKILHAASDVRILASSREALGIGGEVTYRVPSLGLPDVHHLPAVESLNQYEAVRLFIDRARSAVPSFSVTNENAPAVAQICYRLDGIPLAIELAAAKVRVLGVEQIAKRLDDRFRLLTGGSRTALERHQTLRAAIDWSYNLLPTAEQVLFRRLSVFVGGWTLEAAESICGDGLDMEVFDLLEQLINKSLALMETGEGQTRYHMLETMRQYAGEKLLESGESDRLRDRHLAYFLDLAEAAEPHLIRPEQLEWLAKLDADYENLRLALEWALGRETAESSLRLCAALGWFWWVRSYCLEGTKWLSQALAKPSPPTEHGNRIRVKALYCDADLANWLDDIEHMKRSAEQSLALAQEVSDKRDIAIARFYVGWAFDRHYDAERAIPLMQKSLKDFQEIHDVYWESVAYRWLANTLMNRGEIKRAEKVARHLELARQAGERKNLAEALGNYGYDLFASNHVDEATLYAREASALFEKMGIRLSELRHFFAHLAWLNGDHKKTREILMEMKEHSYALGEGSIGCMAAADLGFLALEEGDFSQAHLYLEEALGIAREIGNKDFIAMRLAELGNTFYLEEKIEEFKQNYRDSFLLGKALGVLTKRSLLLLVLDSLHRRAPQGSIQILGAIYNSAPPTHPLWKRYSDRVEAYAQDVLGQSAFESAFVEGRKLSLDQALDLAQKMVEET